MFDIRKELLMFTVNAALHQFIDPSIVLKKVSNTLRVIDPKFQAEEENYFKAIKVLEENLDRIYFSHVQEYLAAIEQELSAQLVYVAWLGFQQNLLCWQNPINAMFLQTDHEDFLRERRTHTLPDVQKANQVINSFIDLLHTLPGDNHNLTDGIIDYVCYIETVGLKVAHYCSFIFADKFLKHVIPGYCNDTVTSIRYKMLLEKYLQLDLDPLE